MAGSLASQHAPRHSHSGSASCGRCSPRSRKVVIVAVAVLAVVAAAVTVVVVVVVVVVDPQALNTKA